MCNQTHNETCSGWWPTKEWFEEHTLQVFTIRPYVNFTDFENPIMAQMELAVQKKFTGYFNEVKVW